VKLRSIGRLAVAAAALCLAVPLASVTAAATARAATAQPSAAAVATFNVLDYGAVGNGTTNDTPAINKAIAAANAAGGGDVVFPADKYLAGGSIHMMSNVTLDLESGSTILGAASGYDPPEPNAYDSYQDYGHSHFHDAVIWGENLTNIGFTGSGTITGNGHLITGTPSSGQADKLISLVNVDGLTISGITLELGGHFALLTQHCTDVVSDHLTISTAADRDGWNVIDTTDVTITNINVASNDDALVFKGDYALGQVYNSGDVVVTNARLSSKCCNALMFGSETCGNFSNYTFTNIVITAAGKSGLGMVSEDGAKISNVTFDGVSMSGTQGPIFEKVGSRLRCGGSPTTGSISDIHYENISGTSGGAYSPTLWGASEDSISGITFDNVHLNLPGGGAASNPETVPTDNGDYNPNSLSTRPAYGFYLHNVSGVTFTDSSLTFSANDQRPAFIANDGSNVSLEGLTVQAGSGSPSDVGFQDIDGYCTSGDTTTTGAAPRISAVEGSTAGTGCSSAGASVSGLSVKDTANAGDWSVQSGFATGDTLYGDRSFTVASVPAALKGKTWIRDANASKAYTGSPLVTFSISQAATVYVAIDTRVGARSWMDATWADTGTQVTDDESGAKRTFEVYAKSFPAGLVSLAPDADTANTGSMYLILVH